MSLNSLLMKLYNKLNKIDLPKLELKRGFYPEYEKNLKVADKNYVLISKEIVNIDRTHNLTSTQIDVLQSYYNGKNEIMASISCLNSDDVLADIVTEVDFMVKVLTYGFLNGEINDVEKERLKLISRLDFFKDLIIFQTMISFYNDEKAILHWDEENNCFVAYQDIENKKLFGFICDYLTQINRLNIDLDEKNYRSLNNNLNELQTLGLARKHLDIFNLGVEDFIEVVNEDEISSKND